MYDNEREVYFVFYGFGYVGKSQLLIFNLAEYLACLLVDLAADNRGSPGL